MNSLEKMSIEEIKRKMEEIGPDLPADFVEMLRNDSRLGVKKLFQSLERQRKEIDQEIEHLEAMASFDREFKCTVIGIDEAGRGPLAGPVVAAAVELDLDDISWALGINDSKQINRKKRKEIYDRIIEKALFCGVGVVTADTIDQINILKATHLAMEKALQGSSKRILRLVDGLLVPTLGKNQKAVVKGDAKSLSIAAASIVAKETRDRLMDDYDKVYPEYGFSNHKGYGTKEHYQALDKHGPCLIHRKSFLKKYELKQGILF